MNDSMQRLFVRAEPLHNVRRTKLYPRKLMKAHDRIGYPPRCDAVQLSERECNVGGGDHAPSHCLTVQKLRVLGLRLTCVISNGEVDRRVDLRSHVTGLSNPQPVDLGFRLIVRESTGAPRQ